MKSTSNNFDRFITAKIITDEQNIPTNLTIQCEHQSYDCKLIPTDGDKQHYTIIYNDAAIGGMTRRNKNNYDWFTGEIHLGGFTGNTFKNCTLIHMIRHNLIVFKPYRYKNKYIPQKERFIRKRYRGNSNEHELQTTE